MTPTTARRYSEVQVKKFLRELQKAVDEFDSFLYDAADEYEQHICDMNDVDAKWCINGPDYDEQVTDLSYVLSSFRDEVLAWSNRLAEAKVESLDDA